MKYIFKNYDICGEKVDYMVIKETDETNKIYIADGYGQGRTYSSIYFIYEGENKNLPDGYFEEEKKLGGETNGNTN
jgi:hypothetical protein